MQQQISQNKIVTPIQQPLQSEPLPLHAARQTMLTQPPIQASSASLQPLESLRVPETEAAAPEPPSSEALLLPSTVGHQRQSETEEYVPQQRGNYRESTSLTLVSPSAEGLARGNENTGLVTSDTAAASISHDGSELLFSASQKPKNRDLLAFVHVPKTGGSSFYDTLRHFTMSDGITWYPGGTGGSASFIDVGCGVRAGSAHCDVAEVDACLTTRYTGNMPTETLPFAKNGPPERRRLYVTVLRDPMKRVLSEFMFACKTKGKCKRKDKRINTPNGPKVLLDWSDSLWDSLWYPPKGGAQLSTCAQVSAKSFNDWLQHPDNAAHARYARFLLPRVGSGGSNGAALLNREHNCLAGDHEGTVRHWSALLAAHGSSTMAPSSRGGPTRLQEITTAINNDKALQDAATTVLLQRFWFVGILEDLEASYEAFCELGRYKRCGSRPADNTGQKHSGIKPAFALDAEARRIITQHNKLDMHLYRTALQKIRLRSAAYRSKSKRKSADVL
jgi:hypothetical protein